MGALTVICVFIADPTEIPIAFSTEIEKSILKFKWKGKIH